MCRTGGQPVKDFDSFMKRHLPFKMLMGDSEIQCLLDQLVLYRIDTRIMQH